MSRRLRHFSRFGPSCSSFRNWSMYQNRNPRPYVSALASMGQQAPAGTQGGKSGVTNLEFRLPCSSKHIQDCNRHFGTQRHDYVPSIWCAVSELCKKCSDEVSGTLSGTTKKKQSSGGRLALSPAPTPKQTGNTRATASPTAHKCMTGQYMLDMFGGFGFGTKATNQLGLRRHVT